MINLVVSPQADPYLNLAVEEHLLQEQRCVTMYLWQNQRTVVIGQNQNPYAECDVERLEQEGGHLARRRTGGGAVFHDLGNLNFSFIVPNDLYDQMRQMRVLQRAVADYGLHTEVSGRNDVLCQGRKFSGNAFSRGLHARLHHGTILIKTDVELLQRYLRPKPAKLLKHGVASVSSRVVNLSELVPPDAGRTDCPEGITAQNIVPHLIHAFEEEYGEGAQRIYWDTLATRPEVRRFEAHFASDQWRFGRWKTFQAQRSAQFDWGGVDLAVSVDQAAGLILSVSIATDALNPDIIHTAQALLTGASTAEPPHLPDSLTDEERRIVGDLFTLIF